MNNNTEKHISKIKICLDNLQSSTNTFPIEVTDTLMKIVQSYYDKLAADLDKSSRVCETLNEAEDDFANTRLLCQTRCI